MTVAWSVGWQEILICLAIVAIPATVAGAVCLAVGLAQRRKPLWVTGVALLAGGLVLLLLVAISFLLALAVL